MGILSCDIDQNYTRDTKIDENNNPVYPVRWIIQVNRDDYFGFQVLSLAQRWGGAGTPVPRQNDIFNYFGFFDPLTTAGPITCKLLDADNPRLWIAEVEFRRADNNSKEEKQRRKIPNPLNWAPIYTVTWDEQQIPLEEARCMTDLPTIKRGPSFEILEKVKGFEGNIFDSWPPLGALVNAVGQQTVDPIMVTVRRPILVCKRNYPFTINALLINKAYSDSFNYTKFLGCDPFTWKFISCEAQDPEEKEIEDQPTITYIPTVTKLGYNSLTWDIKLLNNGQSCFRLHYVPGKGYDFVLDPRSNTDAALRSPLVFPTLQHVLKDSFKLSTPADTNTGPTVNDFEEIESTEPMNLRPDGTQIGSPRKDNQPLVQQGRNPLPADEKANHIKYRHLRAEDFNTMAPFVELVREYREYLRYYNLTD